MIPKKPKSNIQCFGPNCNEMVEQNRPWSKFHCDKCKGKYHIYKNTLIGVISLFSKEAALDMLENLRRRVEKDT